MHVTWLVEKKIEKNLNEYQNGYIKENFVSPKGIAMHAAAARLLVSSTFVGFFCLKFNKM